MLVISLLGNFPKFAYMRPSDFKFRNTALTEAQIACFVNKIHSFSL